ncbi:alpha/beta fold hydrolase [uncultured Friedmanniella sp.]|uniref:alpha/beta fold hydrolase n=1 Tax=uncultured Friedmanniella sp. TaxID=335381 RepID=UPI0035CB99D7
MKLHIDEFGDGGKTLVLIHGASGDRGTWRDIVSVYVQRGYRVLTPDLRGHGLTGPGPSYAIDDFAGDLVESLPTGIDVIAGHSLGGRVLARAVSDLRPGKAVYLDPAFGPLDPDAIADGTFPQFVDGTPMTRDELFSFHPEWTPSEIDQSLASYSRWSAEMLRAPGMLDIDVMPPSPPVVPSLIVLADPSDLVGADQRRQLEAAGYEFRVLAGAGHVLHADDPEGFVAVLDGWV